VYRSGDRMVAVNRPPAEDEPGILEMEEARGLFEGLPFHLFQESRSPADQLQSEFWRIFLFGMLLFLLVEGVLILPQGSTIPRTVSTARAPGAITANLSEAGR
jgi:hypothetical protein